MKVWSKTAGAVLVLILGLMILANVFLNSIKDEAIPNEKIVDINRLYRQLLQGGSIEQLVTEDITIALIEQQELQLDEYMNSAKRRVILLPAQAPGTFYRFDYQLERIPDYVFWTINAIFLLAITLLLFMMLYITRQIIHPFHAMQNVADALKNRDFDCPLPAHKSRFFGKFVWAIDVMREELRYHEQRELELMKEKSVMISSLSHDIKTPLSNICLYNEALKDEIYSKEIIMQRIEENCEKIDAYVKEIMQANRKELFDFSVQMEEVYLHELLDMLKQEQERISLALIHYEQEDIQDGLLYTDRYRLKEVISNVIDNAMKYGDGKWIHTAFYEEEHRTILKISNSGSAISVQDSNAIFQSFYRGSNVGKQQGNGLGLYICKQLMKKMDGDIFLTQQEGSVSFHIVLGVI